MEKSYRVKCESCKKQTTAKNGVCDSCGQYPGIILSFGICPHNPVHSRDEKRKCILQTAKERKGKRVRRVVDSGEVPHLWFHKVQDSAKSHGGNLYFEGDTIYSYGSHFPIAKHVQSKTGKKSAVLFTTRTYSVTTSGHCSQVRCAIPESAVIFHVSELAYIGDDWKNSEKQSHKTNVADYLKRIETAIVSSARARSSSNKQWRYNEATNTLAELKDYGKFFRLKLPKLPVVPALDSKEMAAIRKRESESAARKAEETKQRLAEQARLEAEKAERWRAGENVGYLYNVPVMLRLSSDKTEVETSKGARVPVSHALRGLRFVRAVVARGEAFQTNGHKFPLGVYSVDRVETDGTLKAGCHVISYSEIERLAPVLESLQSPDTQTVS